MSWNFKTFIFVNYGQNLSSDCLAMRTMILRCQDGVPPNNVTPNEKYRTFRLLDNASLGWCGPWTCCPWPIGSSDFSRSLCFMWFWFGFKIVRLVYKKVFFKILNGIYLIWAFNFQKNSTVPYKNWKEISSKLGAKGIKRSEILRWFQKMCRTLASRSSQRFFLRKTIFCKIFQVPKNSVFL